MSGHTPGPWRAEQDHKDRWKVVSEHYSDESVGICGKHSKNWALIESDAMLIAAAPAMWQALRDLVAIARTAGGLRGRLAEQQVIDIAMKALALSEATHGTGVEQ